MQLEETLQGKNVKVKALYWTMENSIYCRVSKKEGSGLDYKTCVERMSLKNCKYGTRYDAEFTLQ